jgi:DNA-binding transcriptional regulator YdaS (Cro superfamily)
MSSREAFARAISIFGSEMKLAEAIGYTQSTVHRAKRTGRPSAEMALAIEVATRRMPVKITRLMLRPDLFGKKATAMPHGWVRTAKPNGSAQA